jgi:hypothetical protein
MLEIEFTKIEIYQGVTGLPEGPEQNGIGQQQSVSKSILTLFNRI